MPGIQFISVDRLEELKDITFWQKYLHTLQDAFVLNPKFWFESKHIGGGAPPIETPHGWLLIYHAVEEFSEVYRAGAVLLDLEDPRKIIGQLHNPLFSPTMEWEKKGVVNNVVFPTAVLDRGGHFDVYYGAGDECIGVNSIDKNGLLKALLNSK